MPWCPECGAEYREGIEACAKCEAALQASPPPPREDPARAVVVRLLHAARRAVVEALSYGGGGWRVLRRHRALLVVPLLVALYQGGDRMAPWTAWVRVFPDTGQTATANELELRDIVQTVAWILRSRLLNPRAALAADELAVPVPWLDYQGTASSIEIGAQRHAPPDDDERPPVPANWPLRFGLYLFGLAVSSLILGGFFGAARSAVERDVVAWLDFGRDGRRYWLRLFLLLAIVTALYRAPSLMIVERWSWPESIILARLYSFAITIVSFFLALTWCAIVTEDARFAEALRRSVVTVARFAAVGVCLLLLLSLLRLLIRLPIDVAHVLLSVKYQYSLLVYLPAGMLRPMVSALLGAWFSLTALHWYRAARAKMAASP
jgi:hypothetical protein